MSQKIYDESIDSTIAKEYLLKKARRNKYSKNLWEYLKKVDPKFFTEERKHLKLFATLFDMLHYRKIWNLGLSFPRRFGKSYTTSHAVSVSIGRKPRGSNMRNAYAASKAEDYSRDTRAFIERPFYKETFPNTNWGDLHTLSKWNLDTSLEHTYTCAGVDGSLTGSGANNLLIGDDLIRNMSEAMSSAFMSRLGKFKSAVHESSMEEGCAHMEIGTRWTRNDPQGEILQNEKYIKFDVLDGDELTDKGIINFIKRIKNAKRLGNFDSEFDWIMVNIPALNLNDESTCESIRSTRWLQKRRNILFRRGQDYIWDSMYQGVPFEVKGLMFPEDKLKTFSLADPEYMQGRTILYCDYASRGKAYHVVLIAKVLGKKVFIIDVLMTKKTSTYHLPKTVQIIRKYYPDLAIFEINEGGDEYANRVVEHLNYMELPILRKFNTMNKEQRILSQVGIIIDDFYFLAEEDYSRDSDYALYKNHLTNFKKEGGNSTNDPEDATAGLAEYTSKRSGGVDVDIL